MLKSKVNLDYNYSIPKMQDITEHTVSYNWNAEKHMEKVLVELHNIKREMDEEIKETNSYHEGCGVQQ